VKAKRTFVRSVLAVAVAGASLGALAADEPIQPIRPVQYINLAQVELGKKLYFDPRLSKSGFISCNSCHNLSMGGTVRSAFKDGSSPPGRPRAPVRGPPSPRNGGPIAGTSTGCSSRRLRSCAGPRGSSRRGGRSRPAGRPDGRGANRRRAPRRWQWTTRRASRQRHQLAEVVDRGARANAVRPARRPCAARGSRSIPFSSPAAERPQARPDETSRESC
jgi:hypothetical protein